MNTARSSALGWGTLVLAAGVSYYWARQGIDERRKQQAEAGTRSTEKLDWRARIEKDAVTSPAAGQVGNVGDTSITKISSDIPESSLSSKTP